MHVCLPKGFASFIMIVQAVLSHSSINISQFSLSRVAIAFCTLQGLRTSGVAGVILLSLGTTAEPGSAFTTKHPHSQVVFHGVIL